MSKQRLLSSLLFPYLVWSCAIVTGQVASHSYSIKPADLEQHELEVVARFVVAGADSIDLMMPVWSPGFYKVQDYAASVQGLKASADVVHGTSHDRTTRPNRSTDATRKWSAHAPIAVKQGTMISERDRVTMIS